MVGRFGVTVYRLAGRVLTLEELASLIDKIIWEKGTGGLKRCRYIYRC
jgi:hypothetical protein